MPDKPTPVITLATKVTIVRILGVPVFIVLVLYYLRGLSAGHEDTVQRFAALVVFALVAVTDALDGYLARSRHEITELGRILDPVADKALLVSGLILLSQPLMQGFEPHIPMWFTAVAISRDVLLIGGYFLVHHFVGDVKLQPRAAGKISTVIQMFMIVWVLAGWPERYFDWVAIVCGFFTLVAGGQYLFDGVRQLEGRTTNGHE